MAGRQASVGVGDVASVVSAVVAGASTAVAATACWTCVVMGMHPALDGLCLGDGQAQQTVLEGRGRVVRAQPVGQGHGPRDPTASDLAHLVAGPVRGVLGVRARGHREHVIKDGDLDVLWSDARQGSLQEERIRRVDDVQRHPPLATGQGHGVEEGVVEYAVHRATERDQLTERRRSSNHHHGKPPLIGAHPAARSHQALEVGRGHGERDRSA